jgi:molybdopterin molybdotransferase/putative molybdopterin biosynthesis protein
MAVKSKIQKIRKGAGLTQTDVADAAGISRQAYTAIESGKSVPSTEIALRLARKLKTTVEDLFWLDDDSDKLVQAELIGDSGETPEGTRMQLIRVGSRLLTRPMKEGLSVSHILNPADAIAIAAHNNKRVDLRLINQSAIKTPTLILSSCDPSTSIIASMIRDLGARLIWIESESIPSLRALARGEIHVAGCNFKDNVSGVYNLPLVKEIVPFPCTIIRFAIWRQGMMITAGNPKSIKHIDDLAMPNVTFINRQPGAGRRGLLNRLIWEAGISAKKIHGYDNIAYGELATAEMVAAGLADCGIGIEASARANDLDFLSLNEEPYDLVIPNHFLELPAIQSLLELLKLRDFRSQIESLGGYDTTPMGIPYA